MRQQSGFEREQPPRPPPHPPGDFDEASPRAPHPSVANRLGSFYARHPQLVNAVGAAALAFALKRLRRRRR